MLSLFHAQLASTKLRYLRLLTTRFPSRYPHLPPLHLRRNDDPTLSESLSDSPRFPIQRLAVYLPQDLVDRRLWATPMVFSNDASRAREDEWLTQLPALPYPPKPTSQQVEASVLGKPKHQRSNPPVHPHPQQGFGNQLPPIRNLVPGLWEPGTSKSSQQAPLDDGKKGSLGCPLRSVGPVWSNKPTNVVPRPQLEVDSRESESTRDSPRQANESKKRPPPSPIERADHERTAPSNSVISSNGGTGSNVQKPSQMYKQTGGKPDVRPRSSSEAARSIGERPGNGSQSSHQQEILRDPVGSLWVLPPSR